MLANLVAAWTLENTESLFRRTSFYHGIHRDDGMAMFRDKWMIEHIDKWTIFNSK